MDTNSLDHHNTYVIGDVHGCFYTLKKLIAKLPRDAELIFVGDLCDKGVYAKEIIEFVMTKGYACVKGNHEFLMEKYLRDAVYNNIHSPWSNDYRYGGIVTFESYLDDYETLERHLDWIADLPIYIERDRYFITHGFALPYYKHRGNPEYNKEYLLNRYEKGMDVAPSEVINIFGHCKFDEVVSGKNFYGIDTGCAYGNKLTALHLGSMQVTQEPMDSRDSNYKIVEMKMHHLDEILHEKLEISELIHQIDSKFVDFDLISTEVASFIVTTYGQNGVSYIEDMLDKKQLFMKQAKKVLEIYKSNESTSYH